MVEIALPIVEDAQSDVERAKSILESEIAWIEACGPLDWLKESSIHAHWIGARDARLTKSVNPRKALQELLDLGSAVVILDVALSGKEEDYARDVLERMQSREDIEDLWASSSLEKAGGLWILREIHRLWEKGFSTPLVALSTQFPKLIHASSPWPGFFLEHGVFLIYSKPFTPEAGSRILNALSTILASQGPFGSLSSRLAGLYHRAADDKDPNLWEPAQTLVFQLLNEALAKDGVTSQREAARRMGIAYNTYRNWIQRVADNSQGVESDGRRG